jgi:hypothetical protein
MSLAEGGSKVVSETTALEERSLAYLYLTSYSTDYCCDRRPENVAELGKAILGLAGATDYPSSAWSGCLLV